MCDPAGTQATFKDGIVYTPSVQTRVPETSCSAIGIIHNSHGHYLELAVTSECLLERLFVRDISRDRFQVRMKGANLARAPRIPGSSVEGKAI